MGKRIEDRLTRLEERMDRLSFQQSPTMMRVPAAERVTPPQAIGKRLAGSDPYLGAISEIRFTEDGCIAVLGKTEYTMLGYAGKWITVETTDGLIEVEV